jgi:hypothetical protein
MLGTRSFVYHKLVFEFGVVSFFWRHGDGTYILYLWVVSRSSVYYCCYCFCAWGVEGDYG